MISKKRNNIGREIRDFLINNLKSRGFPGNNIAENTVTILIALIILLLLIITGTRIATGKRDAGAGICRRKMRGDHGQTASCLFHFVFLQDSDNLKAIIIILLIILEKCVSVLFSNIYNNLLNIRTDVFFGRKIKMC